MDNIILTDVSSFVDQSKHKVIEILRNDAFVYDIMASSGHGAILFDFYNWAFKNCLHRFYGCTVMDFKQNNPTFRQIFVPLEPLFGAMFKDRMSSRDIYNVTVSGFVQLAFNGRLLFIMPCHEIR